MNVTMPLGIDKNAQTLRRAKAEFPDDMSEEEFWNFVCLTGSSLFGMQTQVKDKILTSWDMSSWLRKKLGDK
jgi:hypothetical protein